MSIHGIDHINIDTSRLEETVAFYCGVLGLDDRRKPSGNTRAWLWLGDQAIVHLNLIDEDRSAMPTGSFNHIAFAAQDLLALTAALDVGGYAYRVAERPDLHVTQIFTTDPNGISVELNIPMT